MKKVQMGNNHGQKNRFFGPIFRRKISFRWCWKRFSGGKIGSKKIEEKSPIFSINIDFSWKKKFLIFSLGSKNMKKLLLTGFKPTQNAWK